MPWNRMSDASVGSSGFQSTRNPSTLTPVGRKSVSVTPPEKPTQRRPSSSLPKPIWLISIRKP